MFDRPVATVIDSLRFMRDLQLGNRLELVVLGGQAASSSPIDEDLAIGARFQPVVDLAEDLLSLQDRASAPLLLPSELDAETASSIRDAARLVRRERLVRRWNTIELNIRADKLAEALQPFEQPGALIVENDLALELGGTKIEVGTVRRVYASVSARPDPVLSDDAGSAYVYVLEPGTSDSFDTLLVVDR